MVVVCDISAPPLDFDFNAPVAAWPYYGRVGPQWEVRQWRFFSLVFHTDPHYIIYLSPYRLGTLSPNSSKVGPHEGAELVDSLSIAGWAHERDP